MTELRISDAVCAAFGGVRIAAIVASGFAGHGPWPEVDAELAALERAAAGGETLPAAEDDPHIAAWHAAYRAFGTNPKRERPSVAALRRRLARSGRLPRISAAVDCYNLVSATHRGVGPELFSRGDSSPRECPNRETDSRAGADAAHWSDRCDGELDGGADATSVRVRRAPLLVFRTGR